MPKFKKGDKLITGNGTPSFEVLEVGTRTYKLKHLEDESVNIYSIEVVETYYNCERMMRDEKLKEILKHDG